MFTHLLLPLALALPGDQEVLFLGNSYTAFNDMTGMVVSLATAGGHNLVKDKNTPGGNTLGAPQSNGSPHMINAASLGLIASSSWDFVVLQDQSFLPTIPSAKNAYMFPGAQSLDASVTASDPNTEIILFQTWGRRFGGTFCLGNCATFADFGEMQDALTQAYRQCADLIGAEVAPVGEAWRIAFHRDPAIVLHSGDESHPNQAGSYLAACVFYATIFDESPVGLSFTGSLNAVQAEFLQEVANEAVFCQTYRFCEAQPNSTGSRAKIMALGSTSFAHNDFTLSSTDLPDGSYGLFFRGDAALNPHVPFGDGWLCVGGELVRHGLNLATGGVISETQDFTSPLYQGVMVGLEYYYQYWYRDPAAGGAGFSTTKGLAVRFCP